MCPYAVFSHKTSSFRQIAPYRNKNYPCFLGQPLINTSYCLPVLIKETLSYDLSLSPSLQASSGREISSGLHCTSWAGHKILVLQSWSKILRLFCFSGAFSYSHIPSPSPHPTNNVGRVYPEFFSEFQLCRGWGEEERQENFEIKRKHCFMRQTRNYRKLLNTALLSQGLLYGGQEGSHIQIKNVAAN